jgi:hypothetical protein
LCTIKMCYPCVGVGGSNPLAPTEKPLMNANS